MNTYTYTGYYHDIKVQELLPEEGILTGSYGKLHFKRCFDGFAIYATAFLGSGFVSWPTSENIGYPSFINGIPVTEIHHTIKICTADPIAIEGRQIKRAYLAVDRMLYIDQVEQDNPYAKMIAAMFDMKEAERKQPLEISIVFCNDQQAIELCEIKCKEKCVLGSVSAKHLKVFAPTVVLKGKAYRLLEDVKFTGRVYPYTYRDWDEDWQNTDYFSNLKSLRFIEGTLYGDVCWSFSECISLENVHLGNGILKIPAYAFQNCSSLTDLYIPDTVTEMGEYAFAGCTKLASIHLPSNIKKISKGLFMNCTSLAKCYLSDTIEEIEDEAFKGCVLLKKPWIPKEIKRIGATAFDHPSWGKI